MIDMYTEVALDFFLLSTIQKDACCFSEGKHRIAARQNVELQSEVSETSVFITLTWARSTNMIAC